MRTIKRIFPAAALMTAALALGCGGDDQGASGASNVGGGSPGPVLCGPDFADCDGDPSNGCEGALSTSVQDCGACGVECPAGAHEAPLCSAGACIGVCDTGFADCDGDRTNGCEVELGSDVQHCGACGTACDAVCLKGACDATELGAGLPEPGYLALDEATVYWSNLAGLAEGAGSIMKVAKSGGTPVTLAMGQSAPRALALDEGSVYWVNQGTQAAPDSGSVMKVEKGGGVPVVLASGQGVPIGLALAGNAVYWTNRDAVMRLALEDPGATPVIVAADQARPLDIVAVGSTLYWFNGGTATSAGALMTMAEGGAPVALVENLFGASALALDAGKTTLYFSAAGTIRRKPLGAGEIETVIDGLAAPPWRLAIDATTLYWTTAVFTGGSLNAVALGSKAHRVLAWNQTLTWDVAVDATHVFWDSTGDGVSMSTGVLLKMAK